MINTATILEKKILKLRCIFYNKFLKFHLLSCLQSSVNFSDQSTKLRNDLGISYSNANFNRSDYYLENGLRKVYPYEHKFITNCKKRWEGTKLVEVFSNEFYGFSCELFSNKIEKGLILVNDKNTNSDYLLKDNDKISTWTHRHEPPVLASPIKIIYQNNDILVIDKPHSLPVHPIGNYQYNTVLFILAKEYGIKGLYLNHRLDRLTSGILIFTQTREKCKEVYSQLLTNQIKKTYVCRVQGIFPDGDIICNQPLKRLGSKVPISVVCPSGKEAHTKFLKLSCDNESSVVLCKPLTGRMHQIRVHLQYLGYPILNDILYNSDAFGPERGKNGVKKENYEKLIDKLLEKHNTLVRVYANTGNILEPHSEQLIEKLHSKFPKTLLKKYTKDLQRFIYKEDCHYCNTLYKDPLKENLMIFLHALKYESPDWKFETDMPEWASDY